VRGELQAQIERRINHGATYMGIPARKMPTDAWVYQEIIHELRPDVIVEIGNRAGGTLVYLADLCGLIGHGRVVAVDIDHGLLHDDARSDMRLQFVTGDATAVFDDVARIVGGRSCLVIEDSAHTFDHTLAVLRTYSALIYVGGYLICEDGVMPEVAEALAVFASEQDAFVADRKREWPITWNPGGYLRRIG